MQQVFYHVKSKSSLRTIDLSAQIDCDVRTFAPLSVVDTAGKFSGLKRFKLKTGSLAFAKNSDGFSVDDSSVGFNHKSTAVTWTPVYSSVQSSDVS